MGEAVTANDVGAFLPAGLKVVHVTTMSEVSPIAVTESGATGTVVVVAVRTDVETLPPMSSKA